jgi:hypothetical protein
MTRVWAVAVSRSMADWASSGSAVMVSHSTGAGICSLERKPPASWAFQGCACYP